MTQLVYKKSIEKQAASIIPIGRAKIEDKHRQHLVIKDQQGYDIIPIAEVLRCEADGSYTSIYTLSGKHFKTCKTLKSILTQLPANKFIRIHQSHVVAAGAIRRVDSMNFVSLLDGIQIPYSRRSKEKLLVLLGIK